MMKRALGFGLVAVFTLFLVPRAYAQAATFADLGISKTDTPDPVLAGNNITYTIVVANNGPDATAYTVTDNTPAGTTLVAVTVSAGFSVTAPAPGGTGTITVNGPSLASGATASFTVAVNVNPGTPA